MMRERHIGRALPARTAISRAPDWIQADPAWIDAALQRALQRDGGSWYAVADTRQLPVAATHALPLRLRGEDFVLWRDGQQLHAARDRCPHMGSSLAQARVERGCLHCPWHGMPLSHKPQPGWQPLAAHDDGVILWIQLPTTGESTSALPIRSARPARCIDAVMAKEARCEVRDVLANRLDPWHGAHYHPHSFGTLSVLEQLEDEITVRVSYRIGLGLAVQVDARFHCPDPRTITMTIVEGEGRDSVVETHATPLDADRTLVLEAVLASSDRAAFWALAAVARPLLRRLMRWGADRLWIEDAAYAERLYALRQSRLNVEAMPSPHPTRATSQRA